MSLRNLRKMHGGPSLPPPGSSSDEEYQPSYVKNSSKSRYEGLKLSTSESEPENISKSEEEDPKPITQKQKKKNNKKNRKLKKLDKKAKENFDMDEIDKSLLEVNALLGEPSYKPSPVPEKVIDPADKLFSVQFKNLNVSNELTRLFGPEEPDENNRRRTRQQNTRRVQRGSFIPRNFNFPSKCGLSMSINRKEKDYTYFTFDHSKEYQKRHKTVLTMLLQGRLDTITPSLDTLSGLHVEELIEEADTQFRVENNSVASEFVEGSLAYMLHVVSPFFNITNRKTRLEYKFIENRPFHILLLKYIYLLTNKACHRTALEVAKLMWNLDPSDPLAVQLIIDTLALRAREHQWLVDTIDYLTKEKNAAYMFNMRYSYALAHFHVISKMKGDLKKADNLLKSAILRFPSFVNNLLDAAKQKPNDTVKNSILYNSYASATTSKPLKESINLYANFTCTKWREQPVMAWFLRNITDLSTKFDADPKLKAKATTFTNVRNTLFLGWPEQIIRHYAVLLPMSKFVVDGVVPRIPQSFSFNPAPPKETVDRYGYKQYSNHVVDTDSPFIMRFFSTIIPGYHLLLPTTGFDMQTLHEDFYDESERQDHPTVEPELMGDEVFTSDEDDTNEIDRNRSGPEGINTRSDTEPQPSEQRSNGRADEGTQ